jgi:hypothetical protein
MVPGYNDRPRTKTHSCPFEVISWPTRRITS